MVPTPSAAGAATILLLVATQDAGDPSLASVRSAIVQSLGADADLLIQDRPALPVETEAEALAAGARAAVVGELRWEGPTRERVVLHVHVDRQPEWIDRVIDFRRSDAPAERGRAIGVVLATLVPGVAATPGSAPAEAPVPAVAPTTPLPASPAGAESVHVAPGSAGSRPRIGLGASAVASAGLGAANGDAGGTIDARWYAAARFALRAVGELRFGTVSGAQATSVAAAGGVGAVGSLLGSGGRFVLAVRADVLGSYLRLTRDNPRTGAPMYDGRWLPVIDVGLEATWPLAARFALVAATSGEAALGSTDVIVDGTTTARLAPVRLSAEVGGRVEF